MDLDSIQNLEEFRDEIHKNLCTEHLLDLLAIEYDEKKVSDWMEKCARQNYASFKAEYHDKNNENDNLFALLNSLEFPREEIIQIIEKTNFEFPSSFIPFPDKINQITVLHKFFMQSKNQFSDKKYGGKMNFCLHCGKKIDHSFTTHPHSDFFNPDFDTVKKYENKYCLRCGMPIKEQ